MISLNIISSTALSSLLQINIVQKWLTSDGWVLPMIAASWIHKEIIFPPNFQRNKPETEEAPFRIYGGIFYVFNYKPCAWDGKDET